MAINPESQFSGKINPSSPDYPLGSARDITIPGDGTGTPWVSVLLNDMWGFFQGILRASNITATGSPDTALLSQYLDSLIELASGRAKQYDDTGSADNYVLNNKPISGSVRSLFVGLEVDFTTANPNTGASTVVVNGLTSTPIIKANGNPLGANDINSGLNRIIYNGTDFILIEIENYTYDVATFLLGEPQNTDNVLVFVSPRRLLIRQAGVSYKAPKAVSLIATTVTVTMDIIVTTVASPVTVGTITFTNGSTVGVVVWAADFDLLEDDLLVVAPPSAIPTAMRDLAITLPFIEA